MLLVWNCSSIYFILLEKFGFMCKSSAGFSHFSPAGKDVRSSFSFSDIFIMNNILLFWFRLALTWVNIWPSQTFVWGLKFIALCQGCLRPPFAPLSPLHPPPSLTFPALFLTHTHTRKPFLFAWPMKTHRKWPCCFSPLLPFLYNIFFVVFRAGSFLTFAGYILQLSDPWPPPPGNTHM